MKHQANQTLDEMDELMEQYDCQQAQQNEWRP
jgi:hypothetical protein